MAIFLSQNGHTELHSAASLIPVFKFDTRDGEIVYCNDLFLEIIKKVFPVKTEADQAETKEPLLLQALTGQDQYKEITEALIQSGTIRKKRITLVPAAIHPNPDDHLNQLNPINPALEVSAQLISGTTIAEVYCTDITRCIDQEQKFEFRKQFGRVLSSLAELIHLGDSNQDDRIIHSLCEVGELTGADRIILSKFINDGQQIYAANEWCAQGIPSAADARKIVDISSVPWWISTIKKNGIISVYDYNELPGEAEVEKFLFRNMGIRSLLSILISDNSHELGFITFYSVRQQRVWNDDEILLLKTFSRQLVHGIMQSQLVNELKQTQHQLEQKVSERTWKLKETYELLLEENNKINTLRHELALSEYKYRSIVENQTEVICRFLPENLRIEFVNEPFCRLTGKSQEQTIGHSLLEFLSPLNRERLSKLLGSINFNSQSVESEFQPYPEKDNSWQEWKIRGIFDENGKITEYQAIGRNTTEKKNAQIALEKSEKFYRGFFESESYLICRLNLKFEITYVNRALYEFLGYELGQLLGESIKMIHFEEELIPRDEVLNYFSKPPYRFSKEYRVKTADGIKWINWEFFAIYDEYARMIESVGMGKDITTRKLAEKELLESKEMLEKRVDERTHELRKINNDLQAEINQRREAESMLLKYNLGFMMSVDAVFITDCYGKILDINGTALEITGFSSAEELKGENIFELLSANDGRRIFKMIQPATEGSHVKNLECYIANVQRGQVPLEVSLSMLSGSGNEEDGFVIIARDITERKKNYEDLRQSLNEKDTLLKEIHHRVKNNLQIIHSILSLQSRHVSNKELLSIIEESQDRIRTMSFVHECLYRSQNLSRINMQDYINELIKYLYQSYVPDHKSIMIISDIVGVGMDLQAATPCGIIFNELISNSLKHAFVNLPEGEIKVCFREEKDCYKIRVSDNGCGLPADMDPDNAKTFGLKLIKLLAEQLDGEMVTTSSEGLTTVIRFPK